MSVRKEGESWRVDVCMVLPTGRTARRKKRCKTRREAESYERELRSRLLAGDYERGPETRVPTFREWVVEYMETYSTTNNKPSTVTAKRKMLNAYLIPAFGSRRLDGIKVRDIEVLKAQLVKRGLKAKTVNNILAVLRNAFVVAVEREVVESVPHVRWLKTEAPSFRFLEEVELDALVAQPGRWQSMIVVAARTGLRAGELRALQWQDVDFLRKRLHVRRNIVAQQVGTPKGGKPRVVPLSPDALAALEQQRGLRHLTAPWVWFSSTGSPVDETTQRQGLAAACLAAGVEPHGWHVLRHTFASQLVMRGVPIRVAQELLGHATVTMTERYAHVADSALTSAIDRLTAHGRPN